MSARSDLRQAARLLTDSGRILFSPADAVSLARDLGSKYSVATLRTHVSGCMCINASGPSAGKYPDLLRVSRGVYRMVDPLLPRVDPLFGYGPFLTPPPGNPRTPRAAIAKGNAEALIAGFGGYLMVFEDREIFGGPSLYFHLKALERRQAARSAKGLLRDERFLEYVYAVLPAWGMRRMGKQRAKVPDFAVFANALRSCRSQIDALWDVDILSIPKSQVEEIGAQLWTILDALQSSTSNSRLVSGTKTLHHVLPALVPPIDREYTFRFFTGRNRVSPGEEGRAFLDWWPLLCEIARRTVVDVRAAMGRPEVMATSSSKVIDNAIIGFERWRRLEEEARKKHEKGKNA